MPRMNVCMQQPKRIQFSIKSTMLFLEMKKKLVHFFLCLHMLSKDKPMTNYESMRKLLHCLDVKTFPNTSGRKMASYTHELIVNKTKSLVENVKCIFLSHDEVTTFDQQFWFPFVLMLLKIGNKLH